MTKLCSAFFKYKNNLKIGWEKYRTVLKCTQMRARVEKVDVLGWNKSYIMWRIVDFSGVDWYLDQSE